MEDPIQTLFGIEADNPLLEEALTHPSHANERRHARHYQRLEFLGDAVLGLCATEVLYERFPDADEGSLTRIRSALVSADALATFARQNELGASVKLGRGAEASGLRDSKNVLSDLVEALVAVAYLSGGLEGARRACRPILVPALEAMEGADGRDPKSTLQERVQRQGGATPTYEVLESGGSAHDPWFTVGAFVNGRNVGEGRGRSKRLAERAAAAAALAQLDEEERKIPVEGESP